MVMSLTLAAVTMNDNGMPRPVHQQVTVASLFPPNIAVGFRPTAFPRHWRFEQEENFGRRPFAVSNMRGNSDAKLEDALDNFHALH